MKTTLKSLTTLALTIMSMVAFAQSTATGPNKVYIEQLGSSNTVAIEQVGGTNSVGGTSSAVASATNYGYINGSTNQVGITQTGDNNLSQYTIKGSNNTFNSTLTGNNNSSKLTMGNQTTNTTQSNVTETVTGNSNTIVQNVVGTQINSTLAITGNTNQVTTDIQSSKATSDISITGSNNIIDAQQIDVAGANGHNLKTVVAGDYNSITTQQQGTNDTTFDIKTTGSHNTITLRSSSSAIIDPRTAVAR